MPYGTPQEEFLSRTYKVQVNHATLAAGGLICTLSGLNEPTEADTDQFIQEFIDLVDGSADFVVSEAVKTMPTTQTITPT